MGTGMREVTALGETIRVLLADRYTASRRGWRELLARERGLELAGEAEDAQEALRRAVELVPRVVLLDLDLPGLPPPVVASELKQRCRGCRVLALAWADDEARLAGMIAAGVAGCALKDEPEQTLAAAIRAVGRGQPWMSERLEPGAAAWEAATCPHFTDREREVLELLSLGNCNKEVAAALQLTVPGVRFHLANLYSKLAVQGRGALISWALGHGFGAGRRAGGGVPGDDGANGAKTYRNR